MNEFPSNEHHAMRYAGLRSNYYEFMCDICGRHVLIHANPLEVTEDEQSFVVLRQGDCLTPHSGGVGGLVVNGIEVRKDEDELSDEWKVWLADILDGFD